MSRRDQIRMTDEEVDAYLHETRTMNVASIGPDGRVHLVAMWYGFLDGKPGLVYCKLLAMYELLIDAKLAELTPPTRSADHPLARAAESES